MSCDNFDNMLINSTVGIHMKDLFENVILKKKKSEKQQNLQPEGIIGHIVHSHNAAEFTRYCSFLREWKYLENHT